MVFLARRALQERFTSKGRETTAGQGIEVGSCVCVLNGRHFPLFSAGDRGEVVRVDKEALNCDVLFDGAEQPVPVALRHLKLARQSHSENASAKMVAALRSPTGKDGIDSPPVAKWQTREEVDQEIDDAKKCRAFVGAHVEAGLCEAKGYEANGYAADCFAVCSDDGADCGCGNCCQASGQFASDASIVINRASIQANSQELIPSLEHLQTSEVHLGDQQAQMPASPSVSRAIENSFGRAELEDVAKPEVVTSGPAAPTKEERAAKLADMLAAMDMTGMKFNVGSSTSGYIHTGSAATPTACSSARGSSGVPDFGSVDGTIFTFADSLERAPTPLDGALSAAVSDTCTGEEQAQELVAEDRYDKVEALESRLALLEERHRQEVASLRNALELALAFGREQEARAFSLEQRLSAPSFGAAIGPAISGSPSGSLTVQMASPRACPGVGLGSSPLASLAPPTQLTLPAVPLTPPLGPEAMAAAAEAALSAAGVAAAEQLNAALPTVSGGSLAARLSPGPPLAAALPDGVARTLLLAGTSSAPVGESAVAAATNLMSFSDSAPAFEDSPGSPGATADAAGSIRSLSGSAVAPVGSIRSLSGSFPAPVGSLGSLSGSATAPVSALGSRGGSAAVPTGSPARLGSLSGSAVAPPGNWGAVGSSDSALGSLGGSAAAPVGSVGSLSSRGPNSARSCEGFPGPRRSCSLTAPCAPSTRGLVQSPCPSATSGAATIIPPVRRMTSSPSSSGLQGLSIEFAGQQGPSTPGRARPVAVEVLTAGPSITSTPSRNTGDGASRRALSASASARRCPHAGPSVASPRQLYLVATPANTVAATTGTASLSSSTTDLMGSTARRRQSSHGPPGISSSLTAPVRGSSLTVPTFTSHLSAEPDDAMLGFETAMATAGNPVGVSLPSAPHSSLLPGGSQALGAAAVNAAAISAASQFTGAYAIPGSSRASFAGYGGLPTMPQVINTADMLPATS